MVDPRFIDHAHGRTWLKWHRARRRASDPVFTGARIREAMLLGASVEIDLMVHGEKGFVVMHGPRLEDDTNGQGEPSAMGSAELRRLVLLDNSGRPTNEPLMLLDDLVAELAAMVPHRDALLQLDFKQDAASLDDETIENFRRIVEPVDRNLILSAGDATAVALLTQGLSGIRIGYDPCHCGSIDELKASRDFSGFVEQAVMASPDATTIYLEHRLVLWVAEQGFHMVAAFHEAGRRIDAYTIEAADELGLRDVRRLLELGVDQVTTDDTEAIHAALAHGH